MLGVQSKHFFYTKKSAQNPQKKVSIILISSIISLLNFRFFSCKKDF